jgi:hypothetical protein
MAPGIDGLTEPNKRGRDFGSQQVALLAAKRGLLRLPRLRHRGQAGEGDGILFQAFQ